MPDRILQTRKGTLLTFDVKDGTPVNIKKWTDEPLVLNKLSNEEILDIFAELANGRVRDVEKAKGN